jgi:hypothetical protein
VNKKIILEEGICGEYPITSGPKTQPEGGNGVFATNAFLKDNLFIHNVCGDT